MALFRNTFRPGVLAAAGCALLALALACGVGGSGPAISSSILHSSLSTLH